MRRTTVLTRLQRAAEVALHDVPVLQVPLAVHRDNPVAATVVAALALSGLQALRRAWISMAEHVDAVVMHAAVALGVGRLIAAFHRARSTALHALRDLGVPVRHVGALAPVVRYAEAGSVCLALAMAERTRSLAAAPLGRLMNLADGVAAASGALTAVIRAFIHPGLPSLESAYTILN